MKTVTDQLAQYAAYHRDRRNIATHFVGIPMIVLSVATLLARPSFDVAGLPLSPILAVTLATLVFYFALDLRYGLAMTVFLGLAVWAGSALAAQATWLWLTVGIGLSVVGWAIQLLGHWYEGRKPAFVDDLVGLLIGPLFIVAEVGFALGLRVALRRAIEERVGPTVIRRSGRAATAR